MRNRRWVLWILAITLTCFMAGPTARGADGQQQHIALSVLYVGEAQTDRSKDFMAFLGQHFTKVAQADVNKFREQDVQGFDTVIMDYGPVVVKNNMIQLPSTPFGKTYSRPTIMFGATAGLMSSRMGLKTGYL